MTSVERSANLLSARDRIREQVIFHPHFLETKQRVIEAIGGTDDLLLLTGPAGVGKSFLIRDLVKELNAPVADNPRVLRAVSFVAPCPSGRAFSWDTFCIAWLKAIGEPLIQYKVDWRTVCPGTGVKSYGKEGDLRSALYDATDGRGIEVVVVDEALALLMSERERTLRNQLDVLREISDNAGCKVILVSTPRILEPLGLSGELIRRMNRIFFHRYGFTGDEERKAFRHIVKTFLAPLPKSVQPRLSSRHLQFLQAGSLGCIGILASWFARALMRCVTTESEVLDWSHFEEVAFSDADLATLRRQCEEGERLFQKLDARTIPGLLGQEVSADEPPEKPASVPAAKGKIPKRRVGQPNPVRHRVKSA